MDIKAELMKLNVRDENTLDEYIEFCIINSNKDDYDCVHHIIHKAKSLFPQYKNLKKNSWNASYLSYKNHFIAHWLLLKAVKEKSISFAFFSMKNKDLVMGRINKETIEMYADEYEDYYTHHKELVKDLSRGMVVCFDKDGKTCRVTSKEYQNNKDKYNTYSTDMLNVFDSEQNKTIRIDVKEYDRDIHSVWSKGMSRYYNKLTKNFDFISIENRESYHIHFNKYVYIYRDSVLKNIRVGDICNNDILLDESDIESFYHPKTFNKFIDLKGSNRYPTKNYNIYFSLYTQRYTLSKDRKLYHKKSHNTFVKCIDRYTGRSIIIPSNEFKKSKHLIKYKGIYFKIINNKLYYSKNIIDKRSSYIFNKPKTKKKIKTKIKIKLDKFYNMETLKVYKDIPNASIYNTKDYSIFYNLYTKKMGIYKVQKKHLTKTKTSRVYCLCRFTGRSIRLRASNFDKRKHLLKYDNIFFKVTNNRLYYSKDTTDHKISYIFIPIERKKRKPSKIPSKKGYVLCRDNKGEYHSVSSQEFNDRDDLYGVNKGFVHCTDKLTKKRIKITIEEFKENKHLYEVKTGASGLKNPNVKVVYIYDRYKNLVHTTDKSFSKYCEELNLPHRALSKSMKDGIGIYTKKASLHYLTIHPELNKFVGWTASYTKYKIEDIL